MANEAQAPRLPWTMRLVAHGDEIEVPGHAEERPGAKSGPWPSRPRRQCQIADPVHRRREMAGIDRDESDQRHRHRGGRAPEPFDVGAPPSAPGRLRLDRCDRDEAQDDRLQDESRDEEGGYRKTSNTWCAQKWMTSGGPPAVARTLARRDPEQVQQDRRPSTWTGSSCPRRIGRTAADEDAATATAIPGDSEGRMGMRATSAYQPGAGELQRHRGRKRVTSNNTEKNANR